MDDPTDITYYNRTDSELQFFWLFCLFVAGKDSKMQLAKLKKMIDVNGPVTPFGYLKNTPHKIENLLRAVRAGQYTRLTKAIEQSLDLNLRNASLADLMNIHGVGPKTARFFIVHTRKDSRYAVLDTHILKWIASKVKFPVTKTTPTGRKYLELERTALTLFHAYYPEMTMAEVDLHIWSIYSKHGKKD